MQSKIINFVENNKFQNFIMIIIMINGITMGLETTKEISENYGYLIDIFDKIVISIFTIEVILRIYAHRSGFFKDSWSLFDFCIVAISLVPSSAGFQILRILRVFRLFRLLTVVPQMRKIIAALLSVIPGMASVAAILILFYYIFSIMAVGLYAETFPQWFGTLGNSFYTLFQIMTLESWSMAIVRPVMEVHPYAWTFFVPFIFISTFIMVNLIVAIVVDAMSVLNQSHEVKIMNEVHCHTDQTKKDILEIKKDIEYIKKQLDKIIVN